MDIRPHTLLIAMHLSAVAVGLGVALVADWVVLAKLTFKTVTPRNARQLVDLSQVVAAGLALIWITGLTLVVHNASVAPTSIMNEKLWAKFVIVVALTVNALLLHKIALPMVQARIGQPLFDKPFSGTLLVSTLLGAISTTSWGCAAYLGVARELNGVVKLGPLLRLYLALLVLAWLAALGMSCLAGFRGMRWKEPAAAYDARRLQAGAIRLATSVPNG